MSDCPRTGEPKRSCPCGSCLGRRNRRFGKRKEREWFKAMGARAEQWHGRGANEETRSTLWRAEVKAGDQVEPMWRGFTTFENATGHPALPVAAIYSQSLRWPSVYVARVSLIDMALEIADRHRPATNPVVRVMANDRTAKSLGMGYVRLGSQSTKNADLADERPFIAGIMPRGTSDGLAIWAIDEHDSVAEAIRAEWQHVAETA